MTIFSPSLCRPLAPTFMVLKMSFFSKEPIHEFKLQTRYFNAIISETKTVEGRLRKKEYEKISPGERIRFIDNEYPIKQTVCKVVSIHRYQTFREMLMKEGVQPCLSHVSPLEDAVQIYHSFPNYKELEDELHVVAFRISR